jgi:hypothetical protein
MAYMAMTNVSHPVVWNLISDVLQFQLGLYILLFLYILQRDLIMYVNYNYFSFHYIPL